MRVRCGSYWLAGDPTKTERTHSSTLIEYAPQRMIQENSGLRWPNKRYIDRANKSWNISFETHRLFDTPELLDAFVNTIFDGAHPWSGTVSFRSGTLASWTERDLTPCVIIPPVMVPTGVSLRLRYVILGGTFSTGITSATPLVFDITDEDGSAITDEDGGHIQDEH